jgi:outer membrane protein OmpA-like peptidoglycan-associated protein
MKSKIIAITLTLTLWAVSHAGAESGMKNRRIFVGTNARALGMGSAFAAGPATSGSSFWNASSLSSLEDVQFSLIGLPFSDKSADREGAFSFALNPWKTGLTETDIGNISVASWFDGWGDNNEKNRVMLLGYGRTLGKGIATGANVRHHRRNSELHSQIGWSFDFGMLYSRPLKRLGYQFAVGLSFEDIGGRVWENGQVVERMPLVTRLGGAYHIDSDTILSGDVVLYDDAQFDWRERFRAHLGAERWLFGKRIGIRLGYTAIANYNRFTEGEWSRGFSLRNETGQLDYAHVSGGSLERGTHWLSATLRWGGRKISPIQTIPPPPIAPVAQTPPTEPAPIVMPEPQQRVEPREIPPRNLQVSEEFLSPNGDGIKDRVGFDFDAAEDEAWQVEIRSEHDEIVRIYSGTGSPTGAVEWNGMDDENSTVSDGSYVAQLIVFDEEGNRHPQHQATITVDTTPAALEISAEPLILVSNTDDAAASGSDDGLAVNVPTLHTRASDGTSIAEWQLNFLDNAGDVIDGMRGDGEPPNTIVWNNWQTHQSGIKSGNNYRCVLTVYDLAGNRTTQETSLPVVDLRPKQSPSTQEAAIDGRREERGIVLTLSGVAFDTNSYEIKREYYPALSDAAQAISAYPRAHVQIEGHTDNVGEPGYNLELSRKRANAVMTYLVDEFGISPLRLSAIGYGEEQPVTNNDTDGNRRKNRRVEIVLLTVEGAVTAQRPRPQTVRTPTPQPVAQDSGFEMPTWTVLVSSFKKRDNAALMVESLEALNLGEEIRISQTTVQSQAWYRVTVGHFDKRENAVALIHQLRTSQGIEPIVISAR